MNPKLKNHIHTWAKDLEVPILYRDPYAGWTVPTDACLVRVSHDDPGKKLKDASRSDLIKYEKRYGIQFKRKHLESHRAIIAPKLESHVSYFICLHELGHAYYDHIGQAETNPFIINEEAQAWLWAFDNSLDKSIEESYLPAYSLDSYIRTFPDRLIWAEPELLSFESRTGRRVIPRKLRYREVNNVVSAAC